MLRKKAVEITPDYEGLKELIADLQETMHSASGIGLALVYRVVEEHGGSIEVRSRVGEGTTFVLTLPAPEGAARI